MNSMDLLVLMYHRARAERHGNAPETLDAHFAALARTCHIVLPGEPGDRRRLNVCLTFDDAFFDFYRIVLPLLEKHRLRAVLAVPTNWIGEHVTTSPAQRIAISSEEGFAGKRDAFCTWEELREIAASKRVRLAAHGHRHVRLDLPDSDFEQEIDAPSRILSDRVSVVTDSFVFPYGRYSPRALAHAARSYKTVFRIGGALNHGWARQPLYRVTADAMASPDALLARGRILGYRARYWWNRLRRR